MGAYSSSLAASKDSAPNVSADSTPEAPNRSQRSHCWDARDAFFGCLNQSRIIDSITDHELARERCGKEGAAFEENCARSWVHYFKKRRVMEHKRNETIEKLKVEGAQPLPGTGITASRGPPN
ncbi:MAG: hypothetical protein M1839_000149 [Geoglossum umbratile]|nr:MAG: hypothetical protein M1839_000149 [Geoglossum umbratile]